MKFCLSLSDELRRQADAGSINPVSAPGKNKQLVANLQIPRPEAIAVSAASIAPFDLDLCAKIPFPLFADPKDREAAFVLDQLAAKHYIHVCKRFLCGLG
jgi:hypothetical protein